MSFFTFFGVAIAANFSDITGYWAESDLLWAVNKGLLKGDDVEGEVKTLRPNNPVTRAELATVLKRYDNLLNAVVDSDTDVYKATVNGVIWVGRKSDGKYQAIKIDAEGNESVMYETVFNQYSDMEWNFSDNGEQLVLKASVGGPEGGNITKIAFI